MTRSERFKRWIRGLWLPSTVRDLRAARHAQKQSAERLARASSQYQERTQRLSTTRRVAEMGRAVHEVTHK